MNKTHEDQGSNGLWFACTQAELNANITLSTTLQSFSEPLALCYEIGVEVLTLPNKRNNHDDILISALLLKRVLNDLRSVYIMLISGYTSQAASIAASLFEHALSINAIAGNPEKCRILKNTPAGDLPWSPMELSKLFAKQAREESLIINKPISIDEEKMICLEVYSAYKFLCKIKHPTMRAISHDSKSTKLDNDKYVVMSLPDLTAGDNSMKATILAISISRTYQAVRRLLFGLECDTNSELYKKFISKSYPIPELAKKAYEQIMKDISLPYNIKDEKIYNEYINLKNK